MLRIRRLSAGYHGGTVLHDVDLCVPGGSVQALVGRNGAGKSTLVHTVAGLLRPQAGTIEVAGTDVTGRPAHRVARAGVGLVPQGRRVFASLTVAEHLSLAAGSRSATAPAAGRRGRGGRRSLDTGRPWTIPGVLELFPRLAERLRHRGSQLSGGEQQMLAIGRALLTQPRVLLLDEPGEGLAGELAARVRALVAELAREGLAVLLVEQQLEHAVDVADRVAVLDYGRVLLDLATAEVRTDPTPVQAALSIAARESEPTPPSRHAEPVPPSPQGR